LEITTNWLEMVQHTLALPIQTIQE